MADVEQDSRSLSEVHSSVGTGQISIWKRMFAFAGPAYLVSVGYMDPGNWATDLEGGARFGYGLLWVLVMSNAMAVLLQTLSARLGIVSGRDLAQACREAYPRPVSLALWALCELAIAACDLAEVLGAAIGFNLLFHIPLLAGVLITATDSLLVLLLQRFGIRTLEAFVLSLITVIGACFAIEIFWVRPAVSEMAAGLIPRLNQDSLYVAIAILGATVMPHNLYLHSALVQTRTIRKTRAAKQAACRFNLVDSVVALNGAMLVNVGILVLAAALFFKQGLVVTEIQQAHELLAPMLGNAAAGVVFAVALLCAGQSSTVTGTMAGQIVMEGFLDFRMRPWLRRTVTRALAVIPAALTIYFAGEGSTYKLLILSQVLLSLQLPFAVIPLIHFTSDRAWMGPFTSPKWLRLLAWSAAAIIVGLNLNLAATTMSGWLGGAGAWRPLLWALLVPLSLALLLLLAWISLAPLLRVRPAGRGPLSVPGTAQVGAAPLYRLILVPLDHSELDTLAVTHAAATARLHGARIHLLHVEEGVTSQIFGDEADTAEVEAGSEYLQRVATALRAQGIEVDTEIRHSFSPRREIVACARQLRPDLVVMGAHGHGGIQDLIFGATIDPVRHRLNIPFLIVRPEVR
jgi:manganese transport protein